MGVLGRECPVIAVHRPGFWVEQDPGHEEQGWPLLYICDPIKFPARIKIKKNLSL
jgi:hypothetical protein